MSGNEMENLGGSKGGIDAREEKTERKKRNLNLEYSRQIWWARSSIIYRRFSFIDPVIEKNEKSYFS